MCQPARLPQEPRPPLALSTCVSSEIGAVCWCPSCLEAMLGLGAQRLGLLRGVCVRRWQGLPQEVSAGLGRRQSSGPVPWFSAELAGPRSRREGQGQRGVLQWDFKARDRVVRDHLSGSEKALTVLEPSKRDARLGSDSYGVRAAARGPPKVGEYEGHLFDSSMLARGGVSAHPCETF